MGGVHSIEKRQSREKIWFCKIFGGGKWKETREGPRQYLHPQH